VVAAEQQAVAFEQQAQVVGGVAGRVQDAQPQRRRAPVGVGQLQHLAIVQGAVGAEKTVLARRGGAGQAQNRRDWRRRVRWALRRRALAAQRLQRQGGGRVVGVRVRADDGAKLAGGGLPQALHVGGIQRSGVDHPVAAGGRAD